MSPTATHSVQGFKVTKTEDKTIFHHVPIFAECERGELTFGADWIADAVAEAKRQERDGYYPPLHTRHHEPATDQIDGVRAVGVFRIVEATALTFKGKRITAVFADLIVTDEWMAEELCKMRYPYRSVEIFDPEGPPKINGLALLDHEAPYLELPMLFAGEIDDRRDPKLADDGVGSASPGLGSGVASATNNTFSLNYADNPANPMLGSVRHGNRAVLLFKFPDEETMTETKTEKPAAPDAATNFADDEDKDKKPEQMEDEGGMDVAAVCSAIESGEISVADMDAILAAIQSQKTEEAVEEDEAAPAPAPGAEIMSDDKTVALNFARLQGKNDALEARLDARDAEDARNKAVDGAMERLEGKPLGSDLKGKLVKFYDKANGNAEVFKEYVDTLAMIAGDTPSDDGANFSSQPKTPKSAMAFQAHGSEAVDKAASFARQYRQMPNMRASEESYVRINMEKLHGITIEETTV